MAISQVDQTGVARTLASLSQVDSTGVVRNLATFWIVGPDGVQRQILSSVGAVSVSPQYVSGTAYSKTPVTVSTKTTTVTAPSGSTFSWNVPASGWSAVSPIGASTSFRKTGVRAGDDLTVTFICTVTLPGGSTTTVTVDAEVSNVYS